MRFRLSFLLATLVMAVVSPLASAASISPAGTVSPADWQSYQSHFVDQSGRIVDDANGGISHSEGQGYGLLLAFSAGDRVAFERIWTFTLTELMIRDDGLAAWRWEPSKTPHVTDVNDASDGDILIAYSLALAGRAWGDQRYLQAAQTLAKAIGKNVVRKIGGRTILLPGVEGFTPQERADGPVVNLSYWVFEALPVLAELDPDTDWAALSASGLDLIGKSRFGPTAMPSEWISLKGGSPAPASGFPIQFGYNSLRIPLYLLRSGSADSQRLSAIGRNWMQVNSGTPAVVNLQTGKTAAMLTDPGYRILPALMACALNGTRIPDDLRQFQPTNYYPSTLQLLSLGLVGQAYPQCL
ncbi:endoglucanase [Faunimonas pinastri]|uniref:cellulase n=1 Tax=Faunimonas pinastri TaxID=1855383 RepID=A0A1H9NHW7_9HYPH|nr:glycosyl hydrolase family 8 [Faunimonas pinastri]SER35512.1 endoglucanase [Faunimonas pinastri]